MKGLMLVVAVLAAPWARADERDLDAGGEEGVPVFPADAGTDAGSRRTPLEVGAFPAVLPESVDAGSASSPSLCAQLGVALSVTPFRKPTTFSVDPGEPPIIFAPRVDGTVPLVERFWARATLVGTVSQVPSGSIVLWDTGIALSVGRGAPDAPGGEGSISFIPFSPIRLRPTFDWADSWGASSNWLGGVPSLQAAWRNETVSTWLAVRFGRGLQFISNTVELQPAWFAGASVRLAPGWWVEARGGSVDRGLVPSLAYQGIAQRVVANGATLRLRHERGGGVEPPWDLVTYAADPERFERPLARLPELTPFAATFTLETGVASQGLMNPDVFGQLEPSPAGFVDLQARARFGHLRLSATARARTLTLVEFDAPGLPRFNAIAAGVTETPEVSAILGAELRVTRWLAPAIVVRLVEPATLVPPAPDFGGNPPPPGYMGRRTTILRGFDQFAFLPEGTPIRPFFSATASARFELGSVAVLIASIDTAYDPNRITLDPANPAFVANPDFPSEWNLVGSLMLVVRTP